MRVNNGDRVKLVIERRGKTVEVLAGRQETGGQVQLAFLGKAFDMAGVSTVTVDEVPMRVTEAQESPLTKGMVLLTVEAAPPSFAGAQEGAP